MNALFKVFLSLSFCASPFILLFLLCRPALKNAFSKRWQYYVWLVVLLRLLVPLAPQESPVGALFRAWEQERLSAQSGEVSTPPDDGGIAALPAGPATPDAGLAGQGSAGPDISSSQAPETSGTDLGPPRWAGIRQIGAGILQNLWLLWLGVAAALLVHKATAYRSFCAYIRAGCTEVADIALLERLAQLQGRLHIRRPIELLENAQAASPMLLGFSRPCIVLPCARLPQGDLDCTLLHELTHYRRRDMLYKWGMQLALCLHWFNPLVWRMGREVARACELSCDEAVIRAMDAQGRRAYGDTLLRAAETGVPGRSAPTAVMLGESAKLMKERLDAIMKFKKRPWWACALSLLLACSLALGAAAAGAYTGPARQIAAPPDALQGIQKTAFRYTQRAYYEAPYLFELGWNVGEEAARSYPREDFTVFDKALQRDVPLTVFFSKECEGLQQDEAALQALRSCIFRLYFDSRESAFPAARFLAVSVQNVGESSADSLARRFYEQGSLPQFAAVFSLLDASAQEVWLQRIYEEGKIAFFAASLDYLKPGDALISRFAETAYADGAISFFSVLAGHMDRQAQEGWCARAGQDGRASFRAMLLNLLSDGGQAQQMQEELDKLKQELERRQEQEYAAHGITQSAEGWRWQGQLIHIFQDIRANGALQALAVNPQGTVDIKITRGEDGEIESVGRMTKEEAEALLEDMDDPEEDDGWDGEDALDSPEDDGEQAGLRPPGGAAPAIETLAFRDKTYYLVSSEAQLRAIASGAYGLDKNYLQQADIALSPQEWVPIGTEEQPFTGSYNGNGFEITGLTMTDPQAGCVGMFGAARGADIYNITLRDYDIESAGRDVPGRSATPVLALNLAGSRCYDLFLYPKQLPADGRQAGGNSLTIPVEVSRIAGGEFVWLGEYVLSTGDRIRYDVAAGEGSCLQIAFAAPGENPENMLCMSVKNHRQDGRLDCTADFTLSSPVAPGRYRLFLRAPEGELRDVKGSIRLTLSGGQPAGEESEEDKAASQAEAVTRLEREELPEAVEKAMENCGIRSWYVIRLGDRQYIWYNGMAWEFAYRPTRLEDGWTVDISRMKKKEHGYLLLSLPNSEKLVVTLDGEPVSCTVVDAGR